MSLSIPPQITVPFANAGLRAAIPASSNNVTGRAGYDQGFPPINMTPKVAGGIPPFGTDMNGILYDETRAIQFLEAGNGFVYNSVYATAIGGYRPGARVLRTDGFGYWINTVDGNTVDPEAVGGAAAGWRPDSVTGSAAVTMTNANVTLTPLQFGFPVIVITGTLTANVSLIFPNIVGQWVVLNSTTGNFVITCRTAAGSGVSASYAGGSVSIFGNGTNIYAAQSSSGSLVANGYRRTAPGDLITQWGKATMTAGAGFTTVTFPIAFPTACLSVVGSPADNTGGATLEGEEFGVVTSTTFEVAVLTTGGAGSNTNLRWIAVGY